MSAPGAARRLLRAGGIIATDNALRQGLVADDSADNPNRHAGYSDANSFDHKAVAAVREYNKAAAENARLETFMCPLWDGLSLARLVD